MQLLITCVDRLIPQPLCVMSSSVAGRDSTRDEEGSQLPPSPFSSLLIPQSFRYKPRLIDYPLLNHVLPREELLAVGHPLPTGLVWCVVCVHSPGDEY